MLAGYSMARNVVVCAALCSENYDRSPTVGSGDLFVNLGARRNNTAHHRIAFRNIVADLFVPRERAANEGDSGVRNVQQITPYSVLPKNERRNIHFLPLLRIIGKIVCEKQSGWDPFIECQW